jgi:probable F420-dependent oxidoreductase
MNFGFGLPSRGPLATPDNLIALAKGGEAMGFAIVSVSDHIVIPRRIESHYPYNESGTFSGGGSGEYLEQLTVLGFVAGHTSRIRLLTSVMVLPHRSPVVTAKVLTTIDVLSNGRLIVGCGAGWMREEFEAVGAPPYEERGAVSDEYLRAFKELWTSDNPTFAGKFVHFSDILFDPKPVQKPHPPLWIGGESPPALRRAGRLGDGWYPMGSNPSFPVGTPQQLAESLQRVRRHAEQAGRDPSAIQVAFSPQAFNARKAELQPNGDRRALTGNPEQIAEDIRDFEDIGVQHLMLRFPGIGLEEIQENMERFMRQMGPLLRR